MAIVLLCYVPLTQKKKKKTRFLKDRIIWVQICAILVLFCLFIIVITGHIASGQS